MNKIKLIFLSAILLPLILAFIINKKKEFDVMQYLVSPSNGDYLAPIIYGLENKEFILKSVPAALYYQIMATNFSYVTDYKRAMEYWDLQNDTNKKVITSREIETVKGVKLVDAENFIIEQSKHQQVIMFNEAHHNVRHRVFITKMLLKLKNNGFNYLALEALNHLDEEKLNERKYVHQKSGTYVSEPLFAELINSALKLGFKVVAYESEDRCTDNSLSCRKQREFNQAKALAGIIQSDSSAKIIVLAGYDHIMESGSFKMMAELFFEYSGINPYTIDEVQLCEKSATQFENVYYREICKKYNPKSPVVPISNGNPFILPDKINKIDLHVLFERTEYIQNRPKWMKEVSDKRAYYIDSTKFEGSNSNCFLVQAFDTSYTDDNAIPSDQIIVYKTELKQLKKVALFLKKGIYNIKVVTADKKLITNEVITIN